MIDKTCRSCSQILPVVLFYKSKKHKDGYRSKCKLCHNAESTANYQADKRKWRDAFYRRRYGIGVVDYEAMLVLQDHRCVTCDQPESRVDHENLSVDHDRRCCPGPRSCGKCIRGLLCGRCNRLLGVYETNAELFAQFESYRQQRKRNAD